MGEAVQETKTSRPAVHAYSDKTASIAPNTSNGWLSSYRQKNLEIFNARPVKKSKYTSIAKLEELLVSKKGPQIKIANKGGKVKGPMTLKEASGELPERVELILSKEEKAKDQFEAYINANFDEDAKCVIIVPQECGHLELDVELPEGACAKYFIIAEKNVDVDIIEKVNAKGNALVNETIYLEGNQTVTLTKIHTEKNNLVSYQQCILGKDAKLVNNNSWFEGNLVRANTNNILDGEGSRVEDYSLLLASGKGHFDISYGSMHRAPNSFSHSIFKSALKDESKSVYDGMIKIEPSGGKTNALLETHSMILGEKASSNQIPQLEIKTDDVKATHSATVAHVEEDELFYLEARGVSAGEAKKMVVKGFLESIVLKLPEVCRSAVTAEIDRKL